MLIVHTERRQVILVDKVDKTKKSAKPSVAVKKDKNTMENKMTVLDTKFESNSVEQARTSNKSCFLFCGQQTTRNFCTNLYEAKRDSDDIQ